TLRVLKFLKSIQYPVVISTKSTLLSEEPYIGILKSYSNVIVQFSLSTVNDAIGKITEPNSSRPSDILVTIEKLGKLGIKTMIRWQPYIPEVRDSPEEFVRIASSTGIRHLGFEHLKMPMEKNG